MFIWGLAFANPSPRDMNHSLPLVRQDSRVRSGFIDIGTRTGRQIVDCGYQGCFTTLPSSSMLLGQVILPAAGHRCKFMDKAQRSHTSG